MEKEIENNSNINNKINRDEQQEQQSVTEQGMDIKNDIKNQKDVITIKINTTKVSPLLKIVGWGAIIIGLYFIINNFPIFSSGVIDPKAGLIVVFLTGILTSLHCIGMCGGFVVSYASHTSKNDITPHLCYNGSRLFSYVVLGALLGFAGSLITFSVQLRSYLAILAGIFMIVFGLSMFYPPLRRFVILPGLNVYKTNNEEKNEAKGNKKGPITLGLLNGLMPCGPLQAMLIYAAGTGSVIEGALVMLAFGLGTIPLMFLFGSLTAIAASSRILMNRIAKFSGALVLVLGVIMLNRGFLLLGISLPSIDFAVSGEENIDIQNRNLISEDLSNDLSNDGKNTNVAFQEINMIVDRYGWDPNKFVVKKGVPVKWNIYVKELTYCNKGIRVPELGIDKTFEREGESIVFEFTPNKTGTIYFTCWMGMLPGRIVVVEDISLSNDRQTKELPQGTAIISVRGMCCSGCARRIEREISKLDGVKSVSVNFRDGEAEVSFDPTKITIDKIVSAINNLGYKAAPIT